MKLCKIIKIKIKLTITSKIWRVTYSLCVPLPGEVEIVSVNDKEDVNNDKKVVGVPKGVEPSKPPEGFRESYPASSEPRLC